MAKLQYSTISKRTVEALSVEKDTVFWDRELTGFGVRVYPTGGRVYVAQSRGPEGAKRVTVGRHGVISADQARRRAALIIARIKAGEEPVPAPMAPLNGPTVAELAARYLEEHVAVRCKPATAVQCRQVVDKYILPELGKIPLTAVERGHVIDLHHKLSGVPAMANLVIATLSRMFNQAEAWELVPDGVNPCRFVRKYQERKRERFLTEEEFRRLGRILSEAGNGTGVSARAAAAIRLLMLTGCRRNEILTLRWEDVDLDAGELHLSDSKTGARAVPLSPSAAKLLTELPRVPGNPWVFPGKKPGTHMRNVNGPWEIVRARAGIENVRLHDLRHSFASRALALGESLPMIGKLLGHKQIETTARYAHLARDSVKESAGRIADSIADDILGGLRASDKKELRSRRCCEWLPPAQGSRSDHQPGFHRHQGSR